ncbi:hypothetical protein HW555_008349 [Spodoptera exigua]|uniref:Uncharacterized protein n=1 Tax=Spodoptera exigua TaxID=7107 RepID=A0A835GD48_SPOEX|nr:hypothetical protein HW555_008349 [Spodoptera exigua]
MMTLACYQSQMKVYCQRNAEAIHQASLESRANLGAIHFCDYFYILIRLDRFVE